MYRQYIVENPGMQCSKTEDRGCGTSKLFEKNCLRFLSFSNKSCNMYRQSIVENPAGKLSGPWRGSRCQFTCLLLRRTEFKSCCTKVEKQT